MVITDVPSDLRGGSWNDQGVIIFGGQLQPTIMRVAASGETAVAIDAAAGRHPWFLPDGRHFLYQTSGRVTVGSLDEPGTPGTVVAEADSPAVYAQGHLLYLRENTLMAQPFDASRLETTGEAVPIAEGIPTFTTGSRIPGFAVSAAGLLVYQSGGAGTEARLVWKDRAGTVLGSLPKLHTIGALNLSPDGTRAAVSDFDRGSDVEDLWLYDLDRRVPSRFTTDPKREVAPVWSPDGAMLYFSSDRAGAFQIFRSPANGGGSEVLVLEDSVPVFPASVSPDGKLLLYLRAGDVWSLRLTVEPGAAQAQPSAVVTSGGYQGHAQFSPDGRWVVYQSGEVGVTEVYAAPFPGPGPRVQISERGGGRPRWRKDGKEIFYSTTDRELMAVDVVVRNGTMTVGQARRLFGGIVTSNRGAGAGITYDVSPDGQKFLVFDDGASDSTQPLPLVQNRTALLRK